MLRGEVDNFINDNHRLEIILEKNEDNREAQKMEKAQIVAAIMNLF
jgi:hypothetical protein